MGGIVILAEGAFGREDFLMIIVEIVKVIRLLNVFANEIYKLLR